MLSLPCTTDNSGLPQASVCLQAKDEAGNVADKVSHEAHKAAEATKKQLDKVTGSAEKVRHPDTPARIRPCVLALLRTQQCSQCTCGESQIRNPWQGASAGGIGRILRCFPGNWQRGYVLLSFAARILTSFFVLPLYQRTRQVAHRIRHTDRDLPGSATSWKAANSRTGGCHAAAQGTQLQLHKSSLACCARQPCGVRLAALHQHADAFPAPIRHVMRPAWQRNERHKAATKGCLRTGGWQGRG